MALASTRFVYRAIEDARGLEHPRRLELAGGDSGITDDYCFVGAVKVTIPQTGKTSFLKITLGASPEASWVEAMPEVQDADSVVFDVSKNRIYIHGAFAG